MGGASVLGEWLNSRAATSLLVMGMRGATLAAKFALTVFIARFIGLETLGVYGLIAGFTVMVPVVTGLGLIGTLSRNAVTQSLAEVTGVVRRYAGIQAAIYGTGLLAALVCAAVWDWGLFAAGVVVIVALEHVNDNVFTLLNHLRHPRLANLLMVIRSAGWISAFIAVTLLFPPLRTLSCLLAFWIGGCLVTLACFAFAVRNWPWTAPYSAPERGPWLASIVHESRFLYVNNIANTAGQYLDRYLVGLFMGLELTGVYVLFWSIGNALSNLIDTSVITIAGPNLISAHQQRAGNYWPLFRRLMRETVAGSVVLALAAAALVQVALPYLNRPVAMDWLPVFWLILVGFVLRVVYEVQGVVFYSQRQDKLTLASGVVVLVLAVAVNIVLLPVLSLYGTAVAIIASYSGGLIARAVLIRRSIL